MQLKLFKDDLPGDLIEQTRKWLDTLEYLDSLPSVLEFEAIIALEHILSKGRNKFCRATTAICLN